MTERKATARTTARAKQKKKQIPGGNDRKKGNGNSCSETNISGLEVVVEAEVADYLGGVAVLGVYG
jgi:hypothetical protein